MVDKLVVPGVVVEFPLGENVSVQVFRKADDTFILLLHDHDADEKAPSPFSFADETSATLFALKMAMDAGFRIRSAPAPTTQA